MNRNTPFSFFSRAAEKLRIPLPVATLPLFQRYYQELQSWNRKINLTRISEEKAVYIEHFIDSLIPGKFIPPHSTVIDLGSGGGFPGIPLKIVRPDITVTLVESSLKKIFFLRHVIRNLDLERITAVYARTEELYSTHSPYDVCVSRAYAPLAKFLSSSVPLRGPNGIIIAMKGPNYSGELAKTESQLPKWAISLKLIEEFILPFTNKTRVIIIFG